MYIIVHGKDKNLRTLKGKTITEFSKNLESLGWPSEFANEEVRDRAKFIEKNERRPLLKKDVRKIAREVGRVDCSCTDKCTNQSESKPFRFYKNGMPGDK